MTKEEILSSINIFAVYRHYFSEIKENKNYSQVISPSRPDEKKPSFTVYWHDGSWKDFGSGESGDIFSFIQKMESCDFKRAKELILSYSNLFQQQKIKSQKKETKLKEVTKSELEIYSKNLVAGKQKHISELLKKRKISLDLCFNMKIGTYQRGTCENIIIPFKFDNQNAVEYKIFFYDSKKDFEKFTITRGEATIFPLGKINSTDIIICEGEFDCLSLLSNGFNAITGTAGAGTWKDGWSHHFLGKNVIIIYDNDEPGRNGALNTAQNIYEFAESVRLAQWDNEIKGYDIGDFFSQDRELSELEKIFNAAEKFKPVEKTIKNIRFDNDKNNQENEKLRLIDIFYNTTGSRSILLQRKVAEYIAENYLICTTEKGSKTVFYKYSNGVWEIYSKKELYALILSLLAYDTKSLELHSIVEMFGSITYKKPDLFNARKDLIPLNNCVYDLNNYKPLRHSPDFYFTFKNTYDYDKSAQSPEFSTALWNYSINDTSWIAQLFEIFGYCLTGNYEFQKMFWFTGESGGNGKGTVLRVMQKLVGLELTKPNLSPNQLDGQFYKTALIGKRLAITGDLPTYMKNIDTIKELTGGDRQSTDVKFGSQQDFENTAKLVIAMNRMPSFSAREPIHPIIRRISLLPFEYRIKKESPDFEVKFESELPGIFNHAIDGLKRLRKQRGFTVCNRGLKIINTYAGLINSFNEFMSEHLVFNENRECFFHTLWEKYKDFMKDNLGDTWRTRTDHITEKSTFRRELMRFSLERIRAYDTIAGGTYIKYKGIGLKTEDEYRTEADIEVDFNIES